MIKNYINFLNEVNGTEMVGPVGPGYGETRLQNKTITSFDTDVIYSEIGDRIYTIDEYNQMYQDYLKAGGSVLDGFTKENIDTIVAFFNNKEE